MRLFIEMNPATSAVFISWRDQTDQRGSRAIVDRRQCLSKYEKQQIPCKRSWQTRPSKEDCSFDSSDLHIIKRRTSRSALPSGPITALDGGQAQRSWHQSPQNSTFFLLQPQWKQARLLQIISISALQFLPHSKQRLSGLEVFVFASNASNASSAKFQQSGQLNTSNTHVRPLPLLLAEQIQCVSLVAISKTRIRPHPPVVAKQTQS